MSRFLPSKVSSYLRRIDLNYERANDDVRRDLVRACRYVVIEDTEYDNWNGGTYGHDLVLFLPPEQLRVIDIDLQSGVAESICTDLNKAAAGVENEFFRQVKLELEDEDDPEYQKAIPFSSRPTISPSSLRFWRPGLARLFVSHRDKYKSEARSLAEALEEYGISSFVAHDTIEPMSEWRKEIMKGLESMEVMLVFLTDDFEDSIWTNQEVGFALGRSVPIISLKLGQRDPPGFISHVQALRGQLSRPLESAKGLFPFVSRALGREDNCGRP